MDFESWTLTRCDNCGRKQRLFYFLKRDLWASQPVRVYYLCRKCDTAIKAAGFFPEVPT